MKKITPLGKGIGAGTRAFYLKTSERGNTAELRNAENKYQSCFQAGATINLIRWLSTFIFSLSVLGLSILPLKS
jgi:hypothetical protein